MMCVVFGFGSWCFMCVRVRFAVCDEVINVLPELMTVHKFLVRQCVHFALCFRRKVNTLSYKKFVHCHKFWQHINDLITYRKTHTNTHKTPRTKTKHHTHHSPHGPVRFDIYSRAKHAARFAFMTYHKPYTTHATGTRHAACRTPPRTTPHHST
jgi:hypothetical protein